MKYLVAYYSRTGNTRQLAQQIAEALSADIDEIIDKKKRKGVSGWLSAGRDGTGKRDTEITMKKNPLEYDVLVVGSPVWGSNLTPAIRKYLTTYSLQGKKVAFFATSDGDDQSEVFTQMKALSSGADLLATFGTAKKHLKDGSHEAGLKGFLASLK